VKKTVKQLLFVAGILGALAAADAATFGFSNISNNSGQGAAVAGQLTVTTTPLNGAVYFRFDNLGSIASSITDIYVDDGQGGSPSDMLANDIMSLQDRDNRVGGVLGNLGVDFSRGAAPANLPGGASLPTPFYATAGLSADSDSPNVSRNGINPGEWLGVVVNLITGRTLADLEAALTSGVVRIGLHVQAIGANGQSDSFVSGPPRVPDASTTAMLLGLALIGLEGMRRRMSK
jgi:hypothetical protein